MNPKIIKTFYFGVDEYNRLHDISVESGMKQSEVIRYAIKYFSENKELLKLK